MQRISVTQMVQMAMLAAISIILVYFVHIPLFPAAPFLEYDPADISIILGTFLYGPAAGLVLTAVVSIIQGVTVSAAGGIIGIFMHFVATGSYVLLAGYIYKRSRNLKSSIFAMVSGICIMCVVMVLWNILLTPIYMGVPRNIVMGMIIPVILPFNLIKAVINSAIAFTVYKSVGRFLVKQVA